MKKIIAAVLAVLMLTALVSCGSLVTNIKDSIESGIKDALETVLDDFTDTDGTEPVETVTDETEPVETAASTEEDFEYEIREDDHTLAWESDGMIIEFTHDGKNITGYKTYTLCASKEEAQDSAKTFEYLNKLSETPMYKSIEAKGKYLVLDYVEFPYQTYEEVKAIFDLMQSAQTAEN